MVMMGRVPRLLRTNILAIAKLKPVQVINRINLRIIPLGRATLRSTVDNAQGERRAAHGSSNILLAGGQNGHRNQTSLWAFALRVRTHKGDSIIEGFVIHGFRQETCNESRLFLAYEGSVRTA